MHKTSVCPVLITFEKNKKALFDRGQKIKTQTENNPFKEGALLGTASSDGLSLMMKAMEELDAPENMPEGLDPVVWERFSLARRAKVESEQKVRMARHDVKKLKKSPNS